MKKRVYITAACLLMIFMTACGGPSKAKVEEVQSVYAQLVDRHNEVVALYANLEHDELSQQLDEMAESLKSIGQQDTKEMTNEELDEIIVDLNEHIARYDEILASIEEIEAEDKEIQAIPVTLKNNTGVSLYQLYLYKASETDKGENLVEDMGYLDGNQTCSILNLYMTEDEMLWRLEALDEDGNVIESADIDFTGCGEDGVTVLMEYSFDSMEGWLELE